jgi:hypothetical protein
MEGRFFLAVAAKDIDLANLKAKAGEMLSQRFQYRGFAKNVNDHYEGSVFTITQDKVSEYRVIKADSKQASSQSEIAALRKENETLRAENKRLFADVEQLTGGSQRTGTGD